MILSANGLPDPPLPEEPLKIIKRHMKLSRDVIHIVDNEQYSIRENDLLLKRPTLYRAFNQLNRQPYIDVPEACDSIIYSKQKELQVLQDQLLMYQSLIDFVLADEDSFTLRAADCREHSRCQGRII